MHVAKTTLLPLSVALALHPASVAAAPAGAQAVSTEAVRAAVREVWAAYERDGIVGQQLESEACYRAFSRSPSQSRLDRCMTIDYMGNSINFRPYFQWPAVAERWEAAAKRLGIPSTAVGDRLRRIKAIMPVDEIYALRPPDPPVRP